MASKNEAEFPFPPPGWKELTKLINGRKYKYYINGTTHQKFYSKPSLLRYIKDEFISNEKVQHINEHTKKTSGKNQMQLVQANDYDWLPTGWVVERRFRKSGPKVGTEYKCFIDPSTGSKFFSKPEVLRYLGSKQNSAGLSRGKDKERSGHSSGERPVDSLNADKSKLEAKVSQISKIHVRKSLSSGKLKKIVIEKTVDKELPFGWIKETRIKMLGNKIVRKDPFFADPSSGLVFRSKLEVLRYVETGEISRHAYRRRNWKITREDLATTISSDDKEDVSKSRTKKQLFEGEGSSGRSIEALPKAGGHGKNGVKTKKTPLKIQPPGKEASFGKSDPSSVPSRDLITEVNPLSVDFSHCNDNALTTKRKIQDGKSNCVPLRSSKRLAGVGAEVVFLPIPIEHILRTPNKKPSRSRPVSINPNVGTILTEKQENHEEVDEKDMNKCAFKVKSKKNSKSKSSPSLKFVPKELHERCQDADANNLNDSNFQVVNHQRDEKTVLGIQVEQPLSKINDTSFEEHGRRLDQEDSEIDFTSHGEPFYKIDDLSSQEIVHHHRTRDIETKIMIATQRESSSKIDDLRTKKPDLVDLNDLQLEAPPGFSENAKFRASTNTVEQSLEHPVGTLPRSKVENTSKGRPTLEVQSRESTEKDTEQPESEVSLTAPLWTDPCLDFAFKTLTGAIPFDDNLAIQDYIQHQLRTSEQSPDVPSFFKK